MRFLTVWAVYDPGVGFPANWRNAVTYSVFFVGVIYTVVAFAFPAGSRWGVHNRDAFE